MTLEQIKRSVKEDILIGRLRLEDIGPEDIGDDEPLFGAGLGLDSVESLEVILGMEGLCGARLDAVPVQELRGALQSVNTIARFVQDRLTAVEA